MDTLNRMPPLQARLRSPWPLTLRNEDGLDHLLILYFFFGPKNPISNIIEIWCRYHGMFLEVTSLTLLWRWIEHLKLKPKQKNCHLILPILPFIPLSFWPHPNQPTIKIWWRILKAGCDLVSWPNKAALWQSYSEINRCIQCIQIHLSHSAISCSSTGTTWTVLPCKSQNVHLFCTNTFTFCLHVFLRCILHSHIVLGTWQYIIVYNRRWLRSWWWSL